VVRHVAIRRRQGGRALGSGDETVTGCEDTGGESGFLDRLGPSVAKNGQILDTALITCGILRPPAQ
jgi:hypothetical protein